MSALVSTSIDEAMTDPNLLGAALGDPAPWAAWRVILKAAFALPLTKAERATFDELGGGREPPDTRVKELWVIAGRRGGKSRMAGLVSSYLAAFVEHRLAAGEVGYVLSMSATKSQAQAVLGYARSFLTDSPILNQLVVSAPSDRSAEVQLRGNIAIATQSSSFRTVRGRTLLAAVFDEAAFWFDEGSALPDLEAYRAVLPALATTDGMLIGISSPYRRSGLLWTKFQAAFGKDDPSVLVIRAPTSALNPTIDEDVIRRDMEADPEAARSEWLAEFRSDLQSLFTREALQANVDDEVRERPFSRKNRYVAFADPSGGSADSFTLAIAHKEGDSAILDVVREVKPPFNPEAVTAEFADLLRKYRCSSVSGDRYAGEWVSSAFRKCGVHYSHSEKTKSEIFLDFLPLVNARAVALLDDARSINQLAALERRVGRSGRDTVDHPPGGHDDVANAVAGALVRAFKRGVRQPYDDKPLYSVPMRNPLVDYPDELSNPLEGF